ncbi:MAG: polyprenyl synthetase family protein [Bacteroides sp.]|nr:polyprenyl synthetase family protein [Bacteroides sp.]MCM1448178.1 polyprenyl synthetase family protein [Bacteroides sp.]
MDLLKEIRKAVEVDMVRFNEMCRETLRSDNPILDTALAHMANRTGKQMRPILVILAAKGGCSGSDSVVSDRVLHAAIALELLHTASLVHDDIVDESDRRRGQRSVNSLLDNKAAVLVGDFFLSKSIEHAVACGDLRVVSLISAVGTALADGELLQLSAVDHLEIEESVYYDVVRKKTASLFSACAEIGALLGGGNEGYVFTMKRFGMLLGICFQLKDDIFDYDNSHDVGKPAGNDMKEGKLTLPAIYVAQRNGEAASLAMKVRRAEATEADIDRLVSLTRQEGGLAYAEAAMADFSLMASGLLYDVPNAAVSQSLQHYLDFVSRRDN